MKNHSNKTDPQAPAANADGVRDPAADSLTCPDCKTAIYRRVKYCPECGILLGKLFYEDTSENPVQITASLRNKIFQQGSVGALNLKIQNNTGERLDKIEVNAECPFIDESALKPAVHSNIHDGTSVSFHLNLIPKYDGELLCKIFVTYWRDDDQPNVLETETILYTQKPGNGQQQIVIDRSIHLDQEAYGMDASGDVNININGEKNTSGFTLPKYFEKGAWCDLPLYWSLESTKILRESLSQPTDLNHFSEIAEPADKASHGAWLRFELPDLTIKRVYLHFKPEIHLGRDAGQDIICLCLTDQCEIDNSSNCISRRHLTLKLSPDACTIEDHSSYGTIIDSNKLLGDSIRIHNGQILNLAGVFALKYNEFKDFTPMNTQVKNALLASRTINQSLFKFSMFKKQMKDLPLNSIRLKKVNDKDPVDYFVILKELDIGRADKSPLALPCTEVSELHAKLVLHEEKLRIVDLGSSKGTWVNDQKLAPHAGKTLRNDDIIRLGGVRALVKFMPDKNT